MKTTSVGYVNRNGQKVLAATGLPGTDHNQYVYVLECTQPSCGHRFGANGSDIFERKCPECQDGRPGLPIPELEEETDLFGQAHPTGRQSGEETMLARRQVRLLHVGRIQARLEAFAETRDWDQFHNPKNLAMALAAEAGELLEVFQWLTPEQSTSASLEPARLQRVSEEIADVAIYLMRLADKVGVDLEAAVLEKIAGNEAKYPPHLARGNARKYDKLENE